VEGFSTEQGIPKLRYYASGTKSVWVCEDRKACKPLYKFVKM